MPSNFTNLNLSEENVAGQTLVGQANDGSLTRPNSIHPRTGQIYTQYVAIQRGHLVGLATDGLYYNAFAGVTGSGLVQLPAIGFSATEVQFGGVLDVMRKELEYLLDAPVAGAVPGSIAYLSDTAPGYPTATKPTVSGHLVQIVGIFLKPNVIKYRIGYDIKVN